MLGIRSAASLSITSRFAPYSPLTHACNGYAFSQMIQPGVLNDERLPKTHKFIAFYFALLCLYFARP